MCLIFVNALVTYSSLIYYEEASPVRQESSGEEPRSMAIAAIQ